MIRTQVLLMVTCLLAGQVLYAQKKEAVNSPTISGNFQNAGIADVLKSFQEQSGYKFVGSIWHLDYKIIMVVDKAPFWEVFPQLLTGLEYTYTVIGPNISIMPISQASAATGKMKNAQKALIPFRPWPGRDTPALKNQVRDTAPPSTH